MRINHLVEIMWDI